MLKYFTVAIIILTFSSCNVSFKNNSAGNAQMSLEEINKVYAEKKTLGLDVENSMVYSYFFKSENSAMLEKLARNFKSDLFESEINKINNNGYTLRIFKVDYLQPNTLLEQNSKMTAIALKSHVEFTGFDMQNVPKINYHNNDAFDEMDLEGSYEKNGKPAFVIANASFDTFSLKSVFNTLILIETKYKTDPVSGMPSDDAETDEIGEDISDELNDKDINCERVALELCNGNCTNFLITDNQIEAEKILKNFQKKAHQQYKYTLQNDSHWNWYQTLRSKVQKI
ncbi:MAG: DUF695 domain-containing protein [Bacteroidia bacterium]|nr:DUF695 domain-containing protein [Bacteroidia bacterium]